MRTLIFALLMTGTALAAPLTWSEAVQGLDGGVIGDILVDPKDPDRLVALSHPAGVFTSTDGAKTWTMAAVPPSPAHARLRRDPADPQRLWVSTFRGPLMSKDGGTTWGPAGDTVPDTGLAGLELDPKSKGAVRYLLAGQKFFKKSTDGGKTWERCISDEAFDAVAISPVDPQRIYGANFRGVFVSRDGGQSWAAAAPLTEQGAPRSLVADGASADTLLVSCDKAAVRTTDGGKTWVAVGGVDAETAAGFGPLTADPSDPKRIYMNVGGEEGDVLHASQDGGVSFSPVTSAPAPFLNPIAVAPSKPERLYIGAGLGVLRSDDRGKTWQEFRAGLTARGTTSFALHPNLPGTVYHVSRIGLARSDDAGATWTVLPSPEEIVAPAALLVHPGEPKVMLLVGSSRVAITVDAGGTWMLLKKPPLSGKLSAAFDTSVPGGAYMTLRPAEGDPLRIATTDGGGSWKAAPPVPLDRALALGPASDTGFSFCDDAAVGAFVKGNQLPAFVVRAPSNPQVVYLGWAGGALSRSADGGKTWEPRPGFQQGCGAVNALAVHPDDPDRLYVAAQTGTAVSTDGGKTAQFDALGFPTDDVSGEVTAVAVVPVKPRVLLMGTRGRVFRATIPEPAAK